MVSVESKHKHLLLLKCKSVRFYKFVNQKKKNLQILIHVQKRKEEQLERLQEEDEEKRRKGEKENRRIGEKEMKC